MRLGFGKEKEPEITFFFSCVFLQHYSLPYIYFPLHLSLLTPIWRHASCSIFPFFSPFTVLVIISCYGRRFVKFILFFTYSSLYFEYLDFREAFSSMK